MNVKRKRDFDSQKRIDDVSFSVKDERTGTVRDVRDVTGILLEYGFVIKTVRLPG